jgi:hypothetical protein
MKNVFKSPGFIILAIAIALTFVVWWYQKHQKEKRTLLLSTEKSVETWAIFFREAKGVGSFGTYYYFFNQKSKRVEFKVDKYYKKLIIGDTVLIRYSTKDNEAAEILNPYYMRKYTH